MGIYLCHYPPEEILSVYSNPSLIRDLPPSTFSFYQMLFHQTLDISTFLQSQAQYYRYLSKKTFIEHFVEISDEFEVILPSYSQIIKDFFLNEDQFKLMIWNHEMRLFNINKDFVSKSTFQSNPDFSTVVSEQRNMQISHGVFEEPLDKEMKTSFSDYNLQRATDPQEREAKKEIWFLFLRSEIMKKEPYFSEMISAFDVKFAEKHQKVSSKREISTSFIVIKEFERLKEFVFDLILALYQDFLRKLISSLKGQMYELYDEIRNILDEMFLDNGLSFYQILMNIIKISSQNRRIDFEAELNNPLYLDQNYLDLDSRIQSFLSENCYSYAVEILRGIYQRSTPRRKYDQIMKIKEYLVREFTKGKGIRIETDQIINIFVFIICKSKEVDIIYELIFMEEFLGCHWKEINPNAYFYVAFKTSVHYLLSKGRNHQKNHENLDSYESIFKVSFLHN